MVPSAIGGTIGTTAGVIVRGVVEGRQRRATRALRRLEDVRATLGAILLSADRWQAHVRVTDDCGRVITALAAYLVLNREASPTLRATIWQVTNDLTAMSRLSTQQIVASTERSRQARAPRR
jgi:hypothetical protein